MRSSMQLPRMLPKSPTPKTPKSPKSLKPSLNSAEADSAPAERVSSLRTLFRITGLLLIILFVSHAGLSGAEAEDEMAYTIEELRDSLLENSTDLAKQRSALQKASLDLAQAKAGRFPQIDLSITGSRIFNPMDAITVSSDELAASLGGTLPGGEAGSSASSPGNYITLMEAQEPNYYQADLSFQQPIFTWGKISSSIALYRKLEEVQRLQLLKQEDGLETRLNILIASAEQLSRIERNLLRQKRLAERLVEIVEESYNSGFIVYEKVLEARINAKRIDLALLEIAEKKTEAVLDLVDITGIDDLSMEQLPELRDEQKKRILENTFPALEVLESEALSPERRSLHILALLKEVKVESLDIAKASHYWKPDLALQIDLGYSGSRFPFLEADWYRQNDYDLNLTVAVQTTLWDGGKKLQNTAQRQEEVSDASIDIDAARRNISKELRRTLLKYELNIDSIAWMDLQIEHQKAKLAAKQNKYELGSGSEADLIESQLQVGEKMIAKEEEVLAACRNYYSKFAYLRL